MSKIEIKHPDRLHSPAAYSAGVAIDGWLYVSGQGPLDVKTGKVVEAAGATLEDVVKCTCYLRDIRDFDRFNTIYLKFFKGIRPARTTVQSILWGGIKVETDAIARIAK
jgi:2-iminobutanoate/2-iminopropanoate deaminase